MIAVTSRGVPWSDVPPRNPVGYAFDKAFTWAKSICHLASPKALLFHRITGEFFPDSWGAQFPTPAFSQLLDYLLESGFGVVSLGTMAEKLRSDGHARCRRLIALSFDDGSLDNYDVAFPLLRARGMEATVCITTGLVGSDVPPRLAGSSGLSFRSLNAGQIREMAADGMEIASHGVSHQELDRMSPEAARSEALASKEALEDLSGVSVHTFSYPHGAFSRQVSELVGEAGYESAWTCEEHSIGRRPHLLRLPRFSAHHAMASNPAALAWNGHLVGAMRNLLSRRLALRWSRGPVPPRLAARPDTHP